MSTSGGVQNLELKQILHSMYMKRLDQNYQWECNFHILVAQALYREICQYPSNFKCIYHLTQKSLTHSRNIYCVLLELLETHYTN